MSYLDRLDSYKEDMLKSLSASIAKKSVLSQPSKTEGGELMPFGKDIHEAFLYTLQMGEEMGFEVANIDNYGGHIEFKASEEIQEPEVLAISAHVDVVPEGTGWKNDPFTMIEKDGYVYGRGVADDKGPLIACLYAMKAIKEEGIVPNKTIRLVLGLDEETEKDGMYYYLDRVGQPEMGFTPDGSFPLVNGEMGILIFDLAQKFNSKVGKDELRLTKLESGTAPNIVPRIAKAVVSGREEEYSNIRDIIDAYCDETGYNVTSKKQGSSLVITAEGLAAHGAHPDLGLNAISIMMEILGRIEFGSDELNDFIHAYNEYIGFNYNGEKIGCEFYDESSGPLIFNVGMANISEDIATVTVNIRYPVSNTDKDVYSGIEETIRDTKIGIVKKMHESPVFLSLSNPMVEKMLKAYIDETGDTETKPEVSPGGTYAKLIDNTLAFGALFPGEEDTMHQADERMSIESFYKMARIYARAIYTICCE